MTSGRHSRSVATTVETVGRGRNFPSRAANRFFYSVSSRHRTNEKSNFLLVVLTVHAPRPLNCFQHLRHATTAVSRAVGPSRIHNANPARGNIENLSVLKNDENSRMSIATSYARRYRASELSPLVDNAPPHDELSWAEPDIKIRLR